MAWGTGGEGAGRAAVLPNPSQLSAISHHHLSDADAALPRVLHEALLWPHPHGFDPWPPFPHLPLFFSILMLNSTVFLPANFLFKPPSLMEGAPAWCGGPFTLRPSIGSGEGYGG